jgi:uncharacterized protein YjbI with pentapeptide repeats
MIYFMATPREFLRSQRRYGNVADQVFDGADLTSVRCQQLWLRHCSFRNADLRSATLDGCHFLFCDLRGAQLGGASLRRASFSGCYLRAADLSNADLSWARFGYVNTGTTAGLTDVTGANFSGAVIRAIEARRVIGWPEDLPTGQAS